MKRLALAITVSAVGLLPACFSPTELGSASEPLLSGSWATLDYSRVANGDSLVTQARGGKLTGEWREYRSGALHATAIVGGSYDTSGAFALRLRYSTGGTASYVGNAHGADYVAGTWTDSTSKIWGTLTFNREPPPPCSDPLPVRGTYLPPLAPSYFVGFRSKGDAMAEAARLTARYGITVDQIHSSAPQGLVSQLTAAQLMVLQCESSVDSIAYTAGSGWPGDRHRDSAVGRRSEAP